MILYHASPSYYSQIARLALAEAGRDWVSVPMDIHRRQDQLTDDYAAINPHMTVPTLIDGAKRLTDSGDILAHVWPAGWQAPSGGSKSGEIQSVVSSHYAISIENLTFGTIFKRFPPLRLLFCHLLRRVVRSLEARTLGSPHADALRAKANQNRDRLAWFEAPGLGDRTMALRHQVVEYLAALPTPAPYLFGANPTAADVVVTVLLARLVAIGATDIIRSAGLEPYWRQRRASPTVVAADVWDSITPWRILCTPQPPKPWATRR